jgi:hypothetical protein
MLTAFQRQYALAQTLRTDFVKWQLIDTKSTNQLLSELDSIVRGPALFMFNTVEGFEFHRVGRSRVLEVVRSVDI